MKLLRVFISFNPPPTSITGEMCQNLCPGTGLNLSVYYENHLEIWSTVNKYEQLSQ